MDTDRSIKRKTDLGGVLVSVFGEHKRWDGVDQIETPDEAQPEYEGSGGSGVAVHVRDGRGDPTQRLKMKDA